MYNYVHLSLLTRSGVFVRCTPWQFIPGQSNIDRPNSDVFARLSALENAVYNVTGCVCVAVCVYVCDAKIMSDGFRLDVKQIMCRTVRAVEQSCKNQYVICAETAYRIRTSYTTL